MTDQAVGQFGLAKPLFNNLFFETLLMVIIIIWLLRWLFGFGFCGC